MADFDPGTLNRRVVVKQLASGQDDIGQPVKTWTTLATVWANVRYLAGPRAGVEALQAGAEVAIARASIRIRLRTDITTAMRIQLGSTEFEIKAVLPDEQARDRMDLSCEVVS